MGEGVKELTKGAAPAVVICDVHYIAPTESGH